MREMRPLCGKPNAGKNGETPGGGENLGRFHLIFILINLKKGVWRYGTFR
jgi:hypothetical protein